MSKFRIYNIQLLPNDDDISEVGVAGYRRLFSLFRDANREALRAGTQAAFHFGLAGDTYIGPKDDFIFPSGYVAGNFIRYTKADKLKDLKTGGTVFRARAGKTAVFSEKEIPFVFDTERHFLAIDEADLPKAGVFINALTHLLSQCAADGFPKHELTINLVSRANALEDIFSKAVGYATIDVKLAFPNGHDTEELLRQMKESRTQLKISASAGDRGRMSSVPDFLKDILRASVQYGSAKIRYFVRTTSGKEATRAETYDSNETPVTFTARHSSNDKNERDFFDRVAQKLATLDVVENEAGHE